MIAGKPPSAVKPNQAPGTSSADLAKRKHQPWRRGASPPAHHAKLNASIPLLLDRRTWSGFGDRKPWDIIQQRPDISRFDPVRHGTVDGLTTIEQFETRLSGPEDAEAALTAKQQFRTLPQKASGIRLHALAAESWRHREERR
ncbi:hypothetical protein [Pseudodonghicola xiamenensis]|uniref:hypothetical protein n=1 Tax=Pseudodonghicola xiamenensis TaxID=337702 RepID=UPI0012B5A48D|nr:hypothetical protein [Pseudodonghicola xiamenensis]